MMRSPLTALTILKKGLMGQKLLTAQPSPSSQSIHTVAVIGGGVMGSGIAQVAAAAGNRVYVYDLTDPFLEGTRQTIDKSLSRIGPEQFGGDKGKVDEYIKNTKSNLNYTTDLKAAFDNTELVVEAIYENLEAKRRLFSKLENQKIADPKCIFASNTLNLVISDIATQSRKKDKFLGVRFFFPVPRTKLVEITRTKQTSDETISKVTAWATNLGKFPIQLSDAPGGGGIVHRLPYFRKAITMLARGDASREEIDRAMKNSLGLYKGPLQIMDCIGLDAVLHVIETLHQKYPNEAIYAVPPMIQEMVKDGKLGCKSGEGFYKYTSKSGECVQNC